MKPFEPPKILESFQRNQDYFNEVMGWYTRGGFEAFQNKNLPYHDMESLLNTQGLGSRLFHHSLTAKAIHENLISYIVGTGHRYKVNVRGGESVDDSVIKRVRKVIDRMMQRHEWLDVQEEFYNRWFRTGETLRQFEPSSGILDFQWIEPHFLVPPDKNPTDIAPFGIEYEKVNGQSNVRVPKFYHVRESETRISRLPADRIQHCKRGVDRNDPRGVPLLWAGFCPCKDIDEIHQALSHVAASIAEHAVVYNYEKSVMRRSVEAIAGNIDAHRETRRKQGKNIDAGAITHARDFEVQVNAIQLNATQWIEMLNAKARWVSVTSGIPEFIITGDADTGSRNSLINATDPLVRRILREASKGSRCEIDLLFEACSVEFNTFGDRRWLSEFKQTIDITPDIPRPDTQEPEANSRRVIAEIAAGLQSPQGGCAELGRSYNGVIAELEEHQRLTQERSETMGMSIVYSPEQMKLKAEAASALLMVGYSPEQALEAVSLDPIEHRQLLSMVPPATRPGQIITGQPAGQAA